MRGVGVSTLVCQQAVAVVLVNHVEEHSGLRPARSRGGTSKRGTERSTSARNRAEALEIAGAVIKLAVL
jgi:hypothetical protein